MFVEGTRRTIVVLLLCMQLLVLATALCKNFTQMFSCLRRSDRRKTRQHGQYVCIFDKLTTNFNVIAHSFPYDIAVFFPLYCNCR